jgi:hypothetical protein
MCTINLRAEIDSCGPIAKISDTFSRTSEYSFQSQFSLFNFKFKLRVKLGSSYSYRVSPHIFCPVGPWQNIFYELLVVLLVFGGGFSTRFLFTVFHLPSSNLVLGKESKTSLITKDKITLIFSFIFYFHCELIHFTHR